MWVCVNGRIVPEKRAVVPFNDHGLLYGDGIYETIRILKGRPLQLAEHWRRLIGSARGIRLTLPLSLQRLASLTRALIAKNRLAGAEGVLRVTVTRGPGPHGFDPRLCPRPTLLLTAFPFAGYSDAYYRQGIRLAVVGIQRQSRAALPPSIKSTSCLNGILAKIESLQAGAQEGLMLAEDGAIAEGTVSNIFCVRRGVLYTPKADGRFLPGVTRQSVLMLARQAGYRTMEKKLTLSELFAAEEIFMTSSLMDVLPVAEVVWRGKRHFRTQGFPVTWQLAALVRARQQMSKVET